ncbi:MAG: 3-phosphoglycerate dehydrogenase [Halieaceae bacterium]|jgi:D-3-phosphoglycerate dehydrogenase|nr:3-phosphoglycerate dehydrogenase [Halieaceae bacterium]MDG1932680.1 phosphoglycerate dehydrogenase [Luminiphilus sp.]MDG2037724.1 phosphoglycerate dehydrogenase [Luminiphilus sp.]RZO78742.1 MAG: 3-phosphoglycerate dehydrogenase [Halieaceae bacterium]|tara:strand:+ start:217 stop:1407 length:1191 start_codon:yes stop_codon:yes gene_type:complete
MHRIKTYNTLSPKGLDRFERERYEVGQDIAHPDALLLRSHKLQEAEILESVTAIARAGAGVNNIPLAVCSERGIPVFNTPGANANAVKELVAAAMLLASRDIVGGIAFAQSQDATMSAQSMNALMEQEKKRFAGAELAGKTLGVVGLGAIGSLVARLGLDFGMEVVGFDPALSVEAAWRLPSEVQRMENVPSLFSRSDYVSLHLPVLDSTRELINAEMLTHFRPGSCLLNFAREEIVSTEAIVAALEAGQLRRYVADFPNPLLLGRTDTLLMPHIGASTAEAEENCAIMAANQLKAFLDHGNIRNSVNFPAIELERTTEYRITIANRNEPGMLSHILALIGEDGLNVADLLNKSVGDIAYNIIDLDEVPQESLLSKIRSLEGVINLRLIQGTPDSL